MVNLKDKIKITEDKKFSLPQWDGIKVFSMSLMIDKKQSISMTADRYVQMLNDVIEQTQWDVDYMILDMPAGNSDIYKAYLAFFDRQIIGDVVIIQPAAISDAYRIIDTHKRFEVPILGLIENMSGFQCVECKKKEDLFGPTIVDKLAKEFKLESLGKIPLTGEITAGVKRGNPVLSPKLNKPILVACEKIVKAPIRTTSFLERLRDRVGTVSRNLVEKVMLEFIVSANEHLNLGHIQAETGFTESRPFDLVIINQQEQEVIKRIPLRFVDGMMKVAKTERTPDFELHTSFQTLARIFMGKMKVGNGKIDYDPLGAWLNGDITVYGMAHSPWAFSVLQEIFGNEKVIQEVRSKFGNLLERFI